MTLLPGKTRAHAHIEGLDPTIWNENDYSIVDENAGIADTLDDAKAAFKKRSAEVKEAR
jgi:hypothetical protein